MSGLERVLGGLVTANNRRIASVDGCSPNPRPLDGLAWHARVQAAFPAIRAEWDRFAASGGTLPPIEDLIDEHQGNEGEWRAGLLVSRGRPVEPLAGLFPGTLRALESVPGLRSALWSQLCAGTELPEHVGPNAGVLRYHLGVCCGDDTALRVGSHVVPYREGASVLFDDTAPHAAWNRGPADRITLFCELERPLSRIRGVANQVVQRLVSLDERYREAPRRAAEWHERASGR